MSLNHDELAHSLAMHLKAPNRMVWENLICGSSGNVRPDVYTLQKSFTNPNPMAYEIKVSVSDFRSDVTKAKWHNYKRYAYGVTFAVPMGLITKNDLPEGCGLMTFNGQSWRTVKKATLHPRELSTQFLLKLLMDGNRLLSEEKPIQNRDFNAYQHHETLRKKFGDTWAKNIRMMEDFPNQRKWLRRERNRLCELLDIDKDGYNVDNNIKYKLDEIIRIADEDERKKEIIEKLESLKTRLDGDIDQTIKHLHPKDLK